MKQIIIFVTSAILAVLTPNFASAVDFTITVPLQIENMAEGIDDLNVECMLLAGGRQIQTKHVLISVNSGNGNANATQVQLGFTIDRAQHDPRDVTNYICSLLDVSGDHISPSSSVSVRLPQGNAFAKVVDETQPYRLQVFGDFPRQ